MFEKIRGFFTGEQSTLTVDKSGNATERDIHVATAVLLIEMAGSDNEIAREEAEAVCASIQAQFNLHEDEIPELVETAIAARSEAGKIDQFVKVVNENFNTKQRQRVLIMIWQIVLADGKIDKFEERFAKQMQARLQLSDEIAEEARILAQGGAH